MPKIPKASRSDIIGPSSKMLRTLRIKLIAINMLCIGLVLVTTFAIILYADYNSRLNTIRSELDAVITEATSPQVPQLTSTQRLTTGDRSPVPTSSTSSSSTGSSASSGVSVPTIGSPSDTHGSVVLMSVYNVSPNGRYTTIGNYANAKIPESVILGANDEVLESPALNGFLRDYDLFYVKRSAGLADGDTIIAYADGSSMNEWRNLMWTLIFVGLGALAFLFLVNIFYSRWALKPVRQSIKQQQQFTADASHELKTPLTVILANTEILKAKPEARVEDQMQWVESTHLEAERMQLLVNDMLALLRPDGRKQEQPKEDIDFSDLVEGEVLQFESVAFELGIMLEDDICENAHVMGNVERLTRLVVILIDNACKYAGEGSTVDVALTERPSSSGGHDKVVLKVHNDGPPIPEEDLPHIFDRFYRADKVRTSSKGGYGLGLAIGQEIAHEHDGSISVESSAEDGTTFTVTLPALTSDL